MDKVATSVSRKLFALIVTLEIILGSTRRILASRRHAYAHIVAILVVIIVILVILLILTI